MRRRNGLHRQPRAFLNQGHAFEFGVFAQIIEWQHRSKFLLETQADLNPAWILERAFGVKIIAGRVKLRDVGVGFLCDSGDADHAWGCGAAVIKEHAILEFHFAHVVAGEVVAHAVPTCGCVRALAQVVYRKNVGFGFHQPVAHEQILPL